MNGKSAIFLASRIRLLMTISFGSIGFGISLFIVLNAQEQLGSDIDGEAANDYSGTSVSLDSDGDRVAIGAIGKWTAR